MIRRLLPLVLFVVTGCSERVADMDCSDVADEAISISQGALVAINNRSQTSKDDKRIVCHGTGFAKNGEEVPVRFQAFTSDDGDMLVKYDTDEYRAAQDAKNRREQQREDSREDKQIQQTVDHAMAEGRAEAQAETQ